MSHPESGKKSRELLAAMYDSDIKIETFIKEKIRALNSNKELLKDLVNRQYYVPVEWNESETSLNYRRFFTINEMIYKVSEFDEDTFPLPLVCLPYMIVKPITDGTFTAIKINDETIRQSLIDTEFCSPIHRVIGGHLRLTN